MSKWIYLLLALLMDEETETVAPPQITPHGDQEFIHELVMSLALLSERGKDRVLQWLACKS